METSNRSLGEKNRESLAKTGDDPGIDPGMFHSQMTPDSASLGSGEDLLGLQALDLALNMKMHLVNNVSVFGADLLSCGI